VSYEGTLADTGHGPEGCRDEPSGAKPNNFDFHWLAVVAFNYKRIADSCTKATYFYD
jgi:hypothetical protein